MQQQMTQPDPCPDRMLFCNCKECEGKRDYEFNDMLDIKGDCISRYCADLIFLEDHYNEVLSRENRITNADFDLAILGYERFYQRCFVPSNFEVISETLKPK